MSVQCACGAPITATSKKGECRSCIAKRINADPAVIAKRRITRWGDWPTADYDLYLELRDGKGLSAAEAKRLVLEHQACRAVVAA